ncbi:type II toxin-antitoxin system PemK/MazF family toxin [candidate division WOR-3 bacterium]|nr:type II toxin-antitoxin system PemK/MazF family toxin [candidate division WOR-3 bacterium]
MKRGDIVLIGFPFTDLSSIKVRPALVISSNKYNNKGEDAIFISISSNIKNKQDNDLLVKSSDKEFPCTGLKQASLFRADKIVILKKSLAIRKLGETGPNTLLKVNTKLADILGLTPTN